MSSQTSSTPDKKEVITVQDAKGNVDIPANPQRIVDLSGNSDMLSILGYKWWELRILMRMIIQNFLRI